MTGRAPPRTPTPLPAPEGYRLWAPGYEAETVVSALEDRTVRAWSAGAGRSGSSGGPAYAPVRALLDVGCGTGRRLAEAAPQVERAVGVDLVPEMIEAGRRARPGHPTMACADVRALPFQDRTFDLVWCRLVLGHVAELERAYAELRRVASPGARLVLSDFHPAAIAAGHARSFRDADGTPRALVHHVHDEAAHRRAARAVGLEVEVVFDATPGPPERHFYERAGKLTQWRGEAGLPLVLLVCLRG